MRVASAERDSGDEHKRIFAWRSQAPAYLPAMKSEQTLFGERLRAALKQAGYAESPSELARLLPRFGGDSPTPQAISSWLHGKSMPRHRNLLALATLLRVDPNVLQYGTDKSTRVREPQGVFRIAAQDQHAMDAFFALHVRKRKLVRELIELLSDYEKKR